MTSGLQPGDLVIVAGRPSMGKTSFAMNIAESVAVGSDCRWRSSAWKWARTQLAMRMIGSVGRLDQHKIRTGRLADEDWLRSPMPWASSTMRPSTSTKPRRSTAARIARPCTPPAHASTASWA